MVGMFSRPWARFERAGCQGDDISGRWWAEWSYHFASFFVGVWWMVLWGRTVSVSTYSQYQREQRGGVRGVNLVLPRRPGCVDSRDRMYRQYVGSAGPALSSGPIPGWGFRAWVRSSGYPSSSSCLEGCEVFDDGTDHSSWGLRETCCWRHIFGHQPNPGSIYFSRLCCGVLWSFEPSRWMSVLCRSVKLVMGWQWGWSSPLDDDDDEILVDRLYSEASLSRVKVKTGRWLKHRHQFKLLLQDVLYSTVIEFDDEG